MKKKVLALFLALAMAVSLVTPAIATEPEEEPTLAETVQTLFTTLLGLYDNGEYENAGLILAALALDENGERPEDPELPETFTLPQLTEEDLDTQLQDILTEEQLEAFQTILDEEAQEEEEPSIEEEPSEEEPDAGAPSSEEEPDGGEPDAAPSGEGPDAEEPAQEEESSQVASVRSPVSGEEEVTAAELTLQETFDLLAARHEAGEAGEDYTAVTDALTALTFQEEEPQEPTGEEPVVEEPAEEEPVIELPEITLDPMSPLDLLENTVTTENDTAYNLSEITEITINVGETVTLYGDEGIDSYLVDYYIGSTWRGRSWTSSNNAIATVTYTETNEDSIDTAVDRTATVTGVSTGTTTITHTYYVEKESQLGTYKDKTSKTITVNVVASLEIENDVAASGCFVPKLSDDLKAQYADEAITYKWYRSDSQDGEYTEVTGDPVSSAYAGITNGVNVAVDNGGMKWYKVEAYADGERIATSASKWVPYSNKLENGDFENPDVTTVKGGSAWSYQFDQDKDHTLTPENVDDGTAAWWKTTGPGTGRKDGQDIEYVACDNGDPTSEFSARWGANDSDQYAELNCEAFGALYQDVLTAPGTELYWSLSHRGRKGTDTMAVVVMPTSMAEEYTDQTKLQQIVSAYQSGVTYPNTSVTVLSSDKNSWHSYSSSTRYTTSTGQYLTRFFFVAVETATGDATVGNLIDAVTFSDEIPYTIEYYVDGILNSSESGTAKPYTTVNATKTDNYSNYALEKIQRGDAEVGSTAMIVSPDQSNSLKIYYVTTGISVTKKVVLDQGTMTDAEYREAQVSLWSNYTATFDLQKDGTTVATASVTVSTETGEGVAMFSEDGTKFVPEANTTYSIVETSSHNIGGYVWTKDENVTVTTGATKAASATYTNRYRAEDTVTIHYVPVGNGAVNPASETLRVTSDTAQGSTATPNGGNRFVGWYTDMDCTVAVTGTDGTVSGNKFTPAKVNGKNVAATYYAKFEPDTTSLTITKTGDNIDADQTFLFHVTGNDGVDMDIVIKGTGSVTISGLTVGNTYTVTEDTSWSWRYDPKTTNGLNDDGQITLASDANSNGVTFTNKKKDSNKWLSALASVVNRWTTDKIEQNPGEED